MSAGMREADARSLFHSGDRRDADDFGRALREARLRPSHAAAFRFAGREFLLLQDLDDGSWSYRLLPGEPGGS